LNYINTYLIKMKLTVLCLLAPSAMAFAPSMMRPTTTVARQTASVRCVKKSFSFPALRL
jgi:hypothetical protein